jgi:hypothetical protein
MWAGANPRTNGPRLYERDAPECYESALEEAAYGNSVDVLKRLKPTPKIDDLSQGNIFRPSAANIPGSAQR